MCVRYYIDPGDKSFAEIAEEAKHSHLCERFADAGSTLLFSGEIKPTNTVPVIASDKTGRRAVFPMRWGFRTSHGSLLINARAETAKTKPTFGDCYARHRCIIPASWYFEWDHTPDGKVGEKYKIRPENGSLTYLAGLYRINGGLPEFTVLTREPSQGVRHIHNRMPLILPIDVTDAWINPCAVPDEIIKHAVTNLTAEKTG